MWRSTLNRYREWNPVIGGDSENLCALAATGRADSETPFLAPAKVASTKGFFQLQLAFDPKLLC